MGFTITVYSNTTLTRPLAIPFFGYGEDSKGVALVLAHVDDGKYMRIGVVFGFSTEKWSPDARGDGEETNNDTMRYFGVKEWWYRLN